MTCGFSAREAPAAGSVLLTLLTLAACKHCYMACEPRVRAAVCACRVGSSPVESDARSPRARQPIRGRRRPELERRSVTVAESPAPVTAPHTGRRTPRRPPQPSTRRRTASTNNERSKSGGVHRNTSADKATTRTTCGWWCSSQLHQLQPRHRGQRAVEGAGPDLRGGDRQPARRVHPANDAIPQVQVGYRSMARPRRPGPHQPLLHLLDRQWPAVGQQLGS